jgi:hypothetical protein
MRCLHCDKHLPLFRKLTGGGEFCSDGHRDKYHEEYNKLAVSRLLQAQTRPEEVKPGKKVAAPPDEAAVGVGAAVVVEPEGPELEVVAYAREFQHQPVPPARVTHECPPIEIEPLPTLNSPEMASIPEVARPSLEPAALRLPAALQLHDEAGFLTTRPQPRPGGGAVIETASPLSADLSHVFPPRPDSQAAKPGPAEADAITRGSLPSPCTQAFQPLALGVAAVEFTKPRPAAGISNFSPAVNDFSTAGPVSLTFASMPPEDGRLEVWTMLPFQYLPEPRPSFESGLTSLDGGGEETSNRPVQAVQTPAPAVNGVVGNGSEPHGITPRGVLEVLARLNGETRQPAREPQPAAASSNGTEPPPMFGMLKAMTISAFAPSPAALTAGFGALSLGTKPLLLPYSPLPLRPKMAVGNSLGPVAVRTGGLREERKGPPEAPRNMPRSMLHLEEQAGTDSEPETPTLFGKLGGLFGKKHKNH